MTGLNFLTFFIEQRIYRLSQNLNNICHEKSKSFVNSSRCYCIFLL